MGIRGFLHSVLRRKPKPTTVHICICHSRRNVLQFIRQAMVKLMLNRHGISTGPILFASDFYSVEHLLRQHIDNRLDIAQVRVYNSEYKFDGWPLECRTDDRLASLGQQDWRRILRRKDPVLVVYMDDVLDDMCGDDGGHRVEMIEKDDASVLHGSDSETSFSSCTSNSTTSNYHLRQPIDNYFALPFDN